MRYLFTLFLLGCYFFGFSQKHTYRHFLVEDGLPSLSIYQITQDHDGYIWLTSDKGVSKYDGYRFRTFTVQDGLPTNDIWELYVDTDNRIWLFANDVPLHYIKDDKIIKATKEAITPISHGIQCGNDGKVWVNTDLGLQFIQGDTLVTYDTDGRLFVKVDTQNRLWLIDDFDNILYKVTDGREDAISLGLDTSEVIASDIFPFGEGLVFKTFNDFCYFEGSLKKFDFPFQARLIEQFYPTLTDRNQVFEFKNDILVNTYEVLGDFRVGNTFRDREGNSWYATKGDGVYLLTATAQNTLTYDLSFGLDDQKITATILVDSIVYMGTLNGDFYGLDLKNYFLYSIPLDNARYINDLSTNGEDVFLATDQGLFIFNKNQINTPQKDFKESFSLVNCFSKNCNTSRTTKNVQVRGRITRVRDLAWYGDKLLLATGFGTWSLQIQDNTLILDNIDETRVESAGLVDTTKWLGTKAGLLAPFLEKDNALSQKPVKDIAIDDKNRIWVGTDGYGLYMINDGKVYPIKGTARDLVQQVFIDGDIVWASSNNGLRRIKTMMVNNQPRFTLRTFNASDGLATNEVNTLYATSNNLFVGTNKGLSIINRTPLQSTIPPLHITQVAINQRDTILKNRYHLKHRQNNITISYVGLSYLSNQNIRYEYMMEGIDNSWQNTTITERNYPDLTPGNYTFRLRAVDVEGVKSAEQAILFIIKPPFWATVWFAILSALLIMGGIYIFIQWRTSIITRREAQQRAAEREKATLQLQILEEQIEKDRISKELAQSKLETLQAQLNPHFAYNALTSIQKFILTNDKKEANKYLVKFARLMRQFLEASKERHISLKKEMELLQLYIEMEQLRFKDKFDYNISIAPNIDKAAVQIPSMLLQIYVENAINHGLVYKEGKGHLEINIIKKDDHTIQCIVKDDGIGRIKARAIKQQSSGAYKGLGMKISKERIRYLNMIDDKKVNIEIIDDTNGEGLGGTQVVVTMKG